MGRCLGALAVSALLLSAHPQALADEGLWMVQDLDSSLDSAMRSKGLRIAPEAIFNGDGPGTSVSDAVVSLDFRSSGCLVSDNGLILSDSHNARTHLAMLSAKGGPDHLREDWMEKGFWARSVKEEIPLQGEKVYFLKRVFDITDKVEEHADWQKASGKAVDYDEIVSRIRDYYQEATGLHCVASSAWSGERRFLHAYKTYSDLRLVALPPACVSDFGGGSDCLEWPRHSADFALFRIYEDGKPVESEKGARISLEGVKPGSFSMVIGFPSRTSRHGSSAKVRQEERFLMPVSDKLQKERLEILGRWAEEDAGVGRKYHDRLQALLKNVKGSQGRTTCFLRFAQEEELLHREDRLMGWIDAAEYRRDLWGRVVPELKSAYSRIGKSGRSNAIYHEGLLKGTFIGESLIRAAEAESLETAVALLLREKELTDERVETELLGLSLEEFFTSLESCYYGKVQKKLYARFGTDYKAMARFLWSGSLVSSEEKIAAVGSLDQIRRDPLLLFLTDIPQEAFDTRNGFGEDRGKAVSLEREYERALYQMRLHGHERQYPDADSTMRLSYGTVGSYLPRDGVERRYFSTTRGILEKHRSGGAEYGFDGRLISLMERGEWGKWNQRESRDGMPVAFLSDNDIAGGFYGAPVMNSRGDLIGVSAGGNAEGLGGGRSYSPFYNKGVSIDIRYVMWILDKYAKMKRVVKEFSIAE